MRIFTVFIFFSFPIFFVGQVPSKCGFTPKDGFQYSLAMEARYQEYANNSRIAKRIGDYEIPVILWFIYKTDSSGLGPKSKVYDDLVYANTDFFLPGGIKFVVCEEKEIYTDEYNNLDYGTEFIPGLRNEYYQKGYLNVYIVDRLTYDDFLLGGIGLFIGGNRDATFMDYSSLSPQLLGHELGHCLHLWHTHGKINTELADCRYNPTSHIDEVYCQGVVRYDNSPGVDENDDGISDCIQTGDDVCDTPAEPVLNRNGRVRNCSYIGTDNDYYGDLYMPGEKNLMSYMPLYCLDHFSEGQYERMRFALETFGYVFQCTGCKLPNNNELMVTSLDDSGDGTLRAAIQCAAVMEGSVTIKFSDALVSNIIRLKEKLPNLESDITIDGSNANFERFILEGMELNNLTDNGIKLQGERIEIKNLEIRNIPWGGIVVNSSTDVMIKNCYVHHVGRLRNRELGIAILRSEQVEIKDCLIEDGKTDGFLAYQSSRIFLYDNTIRDFPGALLDFQGTQTVVIRGCTLGNENGTDLNMRAQNGLYIREGSKNYAIGGPNAQSNAFYQNHFSISLEDTVRNCSFGNNLFFCNENNIYIPTGANNDISPPLIHTLEEKNIAGLAEPGATIFVYKSGKNCNTCEGEQFLGKVDSISGPDWELNLTTNLQNEDRITAIATLEANSSPFASCKTYFSTVQILEESLLDDQIYVYPNPAHNSIFIESPVSFSTIQIINHIGKILRVEDFGKTDKARLDVSALSDGTIWLKIQCTDRPYFKKVILNP